MLIVNIPTPSNSTPTYITKKSKGIFIQKYMCDINPNKIPILKSLKLPMCLANVKFKNKMWQSENNRKAYKSENKQSKLQINITVQKHSKHKR